MQDDAIEKPSRKLGSFSGWIIVVLLVLLVVASLTPVSSVPIDARKVAVRNDVMQIVQAINSYKSEYGHLPGNRADGHYDDAAGNAQIFAVLRALNAEQNPRKIVYFEAKTAKFHKNFWSGKTSLGNGFDPRTGVLLDGFGQPYRIRVTPRLQLHADSPYADVPTVRSEVIVWSVGPDGRQGNPEDSRNFAGSDDIYQGLP